MSQKLTNLLEYRQALTCSLSGLEEVDRMLGNLSPENQVIGLSPGGLTYRTVTSVPAPWLNNALAEYRDQLQGELEAVDRKITAIEALLEG